MCVNGWMFLLVPAYMGSRRLGAVKRLYVCVCVCVFVVMTYCRLCTSHTVHHITATDTTIIAFITTTIVMPEQINTAMTAVVTSIAVARWVSTYCYNEWSQPTTVMFQLENIWQAFTHLQFQATIPAVAEVCFLSVTLNFVLDLQALSTYHISWSLIIHWPLQWSNANSIHCMCEHVWAITFELNNVTICVVPVYVLGKWVSKNITQWSWCNCLTVNELEGWLLVIQIVWEVHYK